MTLLDDTLASIEPLDEAAASAARARLDSLTKPRGSLGILEDAVCRYAAIRHDPAAAIGGAAIIVSVADHGVAAEGVSAYPKAVTVEMLRNIARGGAAISVLTKHYGYQLEVVDMGVEADTSGEHLPGVLHRRVGPGTRNMAVEPAMTIEQARAAVEIGIELARGAAGRGVSLLGIGEMGIANSTAAAALYAALLEIKPAAIAGAGTGLDSDGIRHKCEVIEKSLARHRHTLGDPLSTLAALGGFEIAAMAGICLGAASRRVPVVVDGFIAGAAAAVAAKLRPGLQLYQFYSHRSAEGGHRIALERLGVIPLLDLSMRLGEGTGAALAISALQAALKLFHEMATFAGAAVSEKLEKAR